MKLAQSPAYQWGHMGLCNCGFLAQELTGLKKDDIHRRAMERPGDWSEQLNDYCAESGLLMDDLIDRMLSRGLTRDDLRHLERLSDPHVLNRFAQGDHPRHNVRDDVIRYLNAWADLLEDELLERIQLPLMPLPVETGSDIRCNP